MRLAGALSTNRLARNVSANLLGGVWTGLLIVGATPWFVSLLSFEGYGLLSFWLLMQVVLGFFDLGLGATLIREFAASGDEVDGARRRRDLLRTLEWIYWPVAIVLTGAMVLGSDLIASRWLELRQLDPANVGSALRWMALALGLQYPSALYTSGLAGLQRQGRMNGVQMAGNGLRYVGGVAVLIWRADASLFFAWQAAVAGLQTAVLSSAVWRVIGEAPEHRPRFERDVLVRVWRFSAGMALTMVASVLLANADRIYLSKYLPAEELGKYALAFTATGLLQMGIQPFYRAYFPRFAELVALGDTETLHREYFQACRLVASVIIPAAVIGGVFAPELFRAWVGRVEPTTVLAFRYLVVGIAGSGLMWLPAAFQQAHGWTRLHAAMIAGALVVGVPALYWATGVWGAAGAAVVWVIHGVSDITLGLALMHRRLLTGELWRWYREVLLPPVLCSVPIAGIAYLLLPVSPGRWTTLAFLAASGLLAVASTFVAALAAARLGVADGRRSRAERLVL